MGRSTSKALREEVIKRDGCRCKKCGRPRTNRFGLECHHIKAKIDGGEDANENLITLCKICHDEWEAVEDGSRISFDTWLKYPPVFLLLVGFKGIKEGDGLLASDFKKAIQDIHETRKNELSPWKEYIEASEGLKDGCLIVEQHHERIKELA